MFISFFFLIKYTACAKSLEIQESLVLDLKILMYQNADEIEKLKKIKEDSDWEAASTLQQLQTLSESRDSMHRELVGLREVKDAVLEDAAHAGGETSQSPRGLREVCLHHHPTVCGSCTRAGEDLLAIYLPGRAWARSPG